MKGRKEGTKIREEWACIECRGMTCRFIRLSRKGEPRTTPMVCVATGLPCPWRIVRECEIRED